MSRIHEALKRTQQERTGEPGPTLPGGPDRTAAPSAAPPTVLDAAAGSMALAAVSTEGLEEPLTLESMLARCPRPSWQPPPQSKLIFIGSQDHDPGTEEFRTLRSRLYRIRENQPLQVLLITSALPKEGKSFVAANLAQAIGRQRERRVLLIDADLRLSRLHTQFGAPGTPGLTDYLMGDADEFSVIQQTPLKNLFFIPAGKPVTTPTELLGGVRLKHLRRRVMRVFDWVIVDSPPTLPVSDASLLATVCDGAILVVQEAATPFEEAQKALREFPAKSVVGVVLNRAKTGAMYESYKHYYDPAQPASANGRE